MQTTPDCHIPQDRAKTVPVKRDWLFLITSGIVVLACAASLLLFRQGHEGIAAHFSASVLELMRVMIWGVVAGIIVMGFLSRVPRDFVMAALGRDRGLRGILRAVFAGVLLDLCSHGILMVGAKLYERGASAGQVMAFLVASPWNSLSLTLVLVALIGLPWTLAFIGLSMIIGILTGLIFEKLVDRGVLPSNPNRHDLPEDFDFWRQARTGLAKVKWTPRFFAETLWLGLRDSKMILRWLFLGVVIAAFLRVMFTAQGFSDYFGPTVFGLMMTLLAATVIEVCSEGSTPIAGDIVNRAGSMGNGFTFLMAGVATDYTEMLVLRETTKSWKIALFLPLITVPQVLAVGYLLNQF